MRTKWQLGGLLALGVVSILAEGARAADTAPAPKELQAVVDKAADFLQSRQNPDGSFSPQLGGPGITALVAAALIRNGRGPDDPVVAKALGYLEKKVQKDGGVYDKGLANYATSVAIMAFVEANRDGKYTTIIKNASRFLKSLQTGEESIDDADPRAGGVGYDGRGRPDLSNTQFFVEALLAAGVPKSDPAVQRALKFISRCQNLPGETNDQPFAKKVREEDRGGLVYNPAAGEKDPRRTPEGGLRSAAVMTYAGLKSFLHAGVAKDDPRVKAAIGYLRRNYKLDANPGQGQAGLFYYYHTFAKAMAAWGEAEFADAAGKKHPWRKELFDTLKARQKADGSWANRNKQFFENNPDLATAFALLALSYCKPAK